MHRVLYILLFVAGAAAGIVLTVPFYIDRSTDPYIFASVNEAPTSTVAIVLGASVVRGQPSPILQERAEAALELYRAGKVQKILVTGDDSVEGFDEVSPVRRYFESEGVPGANIFLDHAGFDTYSSMYRARDIFLVRDAVIVTQAFHLPRAVFLARSLGINASGVTADQQGGALYNYVREVPASFKAVSNLMFKRVPKYLGEQFPITGDGQETWE